MGSISALIQRVHVVHGRSPSRVVRVSANSRVRRVTHRIGGVIHDVRRLDRHGVTLTRIGGQVRVRGLRTRVGPRFVCGALSGVHCLVPASPRQTRRLVKQFVNVLHCDVGGAGRGIPIGSSLGCLRSCLIVRSAHFNTGFSCRVSVSSTYVRFVVPGLLLRPLLRGDVGCKFRGGPHVRVEMQN